MALPSFSGVVSACCSTKTRKSCHESRIRRLNGCPCPAKNQLTAENTTAKNLIGAENSMTPLFYNWKSRTPATCNSCGGECTVSSCCNGLVCINGGIFVGESICAEPVQCRVCMGGSSGVCQNPLNGVCYPLPSDGSCPVGTSPCHSKSSSDW